MIQPILIPILLDGKELYQLIEPWSFVYHGTRIDLPLGMVVDGASVPRALWTFMPPDGAHRGAALAHDYLYARKGQLPQYSLCLRRIDCDRVFYNLMVEAGLSRLRAGIAYRGVRMGGWVPWNKEASSSDLLVLPIRNAAPASLRRKHIIRHLYA